jgi:DNA polymerase elongation subunit (family B)
MRPKPKVLLFDIETTPHLGFTWGKYDQTVVGFSKHSHLLSFSAKWLREAIVTKGLIDYPGYRKDRHNDKALIQDLWRLLDEADIVVAHNGRAFDTKKVNARFSFHHIAPPAPYKIVDTKEMSKKYFNFTSNSLDDISQYLGVGKKMPTAGFELWLDCMAGVPEAWATMKAYNAHDVVLLEAIYLHMLPWMEQHPNMSSLMEGTVCPKCGSTHIHSRGEIRTQSSVYRKFQCQDCGGWGRSVKRERSISGVIKNIA